MAVAFPALPARTRLTLKARWSRQLLDVLGVRLSAQGTPPVGGFVVANHVSWLDIFAINALAPATFLSKDDVRRWPVIGWLADRAGTLFIERGSRAAAARAKEHLIGALRSGHRVAVFPEGATGHGDHVLPFHGALFQSAIDAGVPVAPVLLRYRTPDGRPNAAAAYVGDTTFWECLRAIAGAPDLVASVEFLHVIETTGADRRHLAHRSHQLIAHALAESTPSLAVRPGVDMATEISAGLPAEPPSASRPTGSRNPAPADSFRA